MENVHSGPVRLIQISDLHCYADDDAKLEWSDIPLYPNRSLIRVIDHLQKIAQSFDVLVISGDLVQEETAQSYQRIAQILQGFPRPIYIFPGNHDIPALMQVHLVDVDKNIHFCLSETFANWHCLFLDTNAPQCPDGHISAEEFAAIEKALGQMTTNEYALILMHHHPLPIGSPWMDTMGLQQTEQFWDLIKKYPQVASIVFGHIHSEFAVQYPLGEDRTVEVLGTPATCVQVKHIDENLHLDHARPAWREVSLLADGGVETAVHYLPDV